MHFPDVFDTYHEDYAPLPHQLLINAGSWVIRGIDSQVRIADLTPASRGPGPDRRITFQLPRKRGP